MRDIFVNMKWGLMGLVASLMRSELIWLERRHNMRIVGCARWE